MRDSTNNPNGATTTGLIHTIINGIAMGRAAQACGSTGLGGTSSSSWQHATMQMKMIASEADE